MLGFLTKVFELFLEFFQIFVRQIFKIDKFVSRVFEGADNLIEFKMHCFGIAVLRVLNQKHHEEGNDRRRSVNNELPGIGKMKRWSGEEPHQNDEHSSGKRPGAPEDDGGSPGENAKRITHHTKKVSLYEALF